MGYSEAAKKDVENVTDHAKHPESRAGCPAKHRLEDLEPYRPGRPLPDAARRARAIKEHQKERGVRFEDSAAIVRADRDYRTWPAETSRVEGEEKRGCPR